jgi:subtilisin family serine protease
MIRLRRLGALVLWMGCLLGSSVQASQTPEGTVDWDSVDEAEIVPGELLVLFKNDGARPDSIGDAARVTIHASMGAELKRRFKLIPWDCVKVPAANRSELQQMAQRYLSDPNVAYVEPNYRVYPIDTVPNDPDYGDLWGMERINAPQAWDFTTGSTNIVVAVIDTGINLTHEDLVDNLWTNPGEIAGDGIDNDGNGFVDDVNGWDFVNDDNDPTDDHGHGTHCAGTIGAVGNNSVGVAGVCWNVKIVGIKFLGLAGGSTADAIASVEYATGLSQYIRLTSNSWGGGGESAALEAAINASGVAGQLFIAAAGNDAVDNDVTPHYPSSYESENLIAVASIAEGGDLSGFSCYGLTSVDLAAPGSDIRSCWIGGNDKYNTISGTSMATPHVSGAAALLWSLRPEYDWQEIETAILENVATNAALEGKMVTEGELDLFAAIQDLGASLKLDRLAYRSDATVNVEVSDSDSDTNSPNVDVHWATTDALGSLRSESDITLADDGSGYKFVGSFTLVPGVTNDALHGDTLTVEYDPPSFDPLTVSVPIDDIPPVISDIEATDLTESSFVVRWATDEPADSHVLIAESLPLTGAPEQGSDAFVVSPTIAGGVTQYLHSVLVTGLTERTRYYVAVMSADYAGNTTTNPTDVSSVNTADYLNAITRFRRVVKTIDFEDGDAGWTHGGLNDSWEYGTPTYGPPDAPFGSKGWGTDLDDRYDNLANAWLKSGAMQIGYKGQVTMQMWYEIEASYDANSPYDQGFIELYDGSGWHNVTANADVFAGQTYIDGTLYYGWQTVTLDLSAYEGKTVWLRYRLETDDSTVQAGWYLDDLELSDIQPDGVWVERVVVDDATGGDGDGYAEPGESLILSVYAGHYDGVTIYSQTVATVECPTDGVDTEFSPETIPYGDLAALVSTSGSRQIPVTVAADVPQDTVASFLYSISSTTPSNGGPWEGEFSIMIGERETLTGVVSNIVDGTPIEDAVVRGTATGYADLTATSAVDGSYALNGLVPGVTYEVTACKTNAFSPCIPVATTGAGVLNIGLGKAYGVPSPAFFVDFINEGETNLVMWDIVFDNSAGTVDYVYQASVDYEDFFFSSRDGWMELSPMTGTVAAGTVQTNSIVIDPVGLDPDLYIANITLQGNDISCEDVEIPVWLILEEAPLLELVSVDVAGGDGDPYVEPNETNTLSLVLRNRGSDSSTTTTGLLSTASALTIVSNAVAWPTIEAHPGPGHIQASSTDPSIAVGAAADGTVFPLSLAVASLEGTWQFDFSVTTMVRQAVSGQVTDGVTSNAVAGCRVKAHGPAGTESTALTDATGAYVLYGLTNANYTIAVIPPADYDAPGTESVAIVGADVAGVDFVLQPWDLTLSPASFSKVIYEGEDTTDMLEVGKLSAGGGYVEFEVEQTGVIPPTVPDQQGPAVDWASLTAEDCSLGQVFVTFRDNVDLQAQSTILADQGLRVGRRFSLTDAVLVNVPKHSSMAQVAGILTADSSVAHVEPNYRYKPSIMPNDVSFDDLYGLHNVRQTGGSLDSDIDAPEAWDTTTGDTNIIVAVIDTGVELSHEDLQGQCIQGFDFGAVTTEEIITGADGIVTVYTGTLTTPPIIPGSMMVHATNANRDVIIFLDDGVNNLVSTNGAVPPHGTIDYTTGAWTLDFENTPPLGIVTATFTDGDPTPDYAEGLAVSVNHGTHVAGTIAAAGNNSTGVVGVAFNTRIMPLKASTNILSWIGFIPVFYQDSLLAALDHAVLHGARVSNHSYGGTSFSPVMRSAFSNAMAYGHIAVCAAGNEGADADNPAVTAYPAGYNLPNIISVAAMDHNDGLASFSNYGAENVDLGAPGVSILSCSASWDTATTNATTDEYESMSGTSMASPHVAGIMGLLASQAPDAPWDTLVQALFEGVRPDPNLEGVVRYAGHANAYESLRILRPFWLSVNPSFAAIPDGGTATNEVTFNSGKHLSAGSYDANIVVVNGSHSTNVPVALTVLAAPRPAVGEVLVLGGDGDGIAEPNETVQLQIALTNEGSAFVLSPTGMLSSAGATVTSGEAAWNSLQIGGSSVPTVSPEVQFGAVVASPVPFALTVGDNPASGRGPWDLTFNLDVVAANSVSGSVRNTSGTTLSGVPIEYWGAAAGTGVTDVAGTFWIHGLPTNGTVKVRALPDSYAKSAHQTWDLSLGNGAMSFVVAKPVASFSTDTVTAAVQHGLATTASFMINNTASDALNFQCLEMPARKVALISDGTQLNPLSNVLETFGLSVSVYSNNYEMVYDPDYPPGTWTGTPTTYYSSDDAIVYGHDLVIADLSGRQNGGRLFTATEKGIFEQYLNRGGKLIVTGANPLSSPDSPEMMELVGATTLNQLSSTATTAIMTNTLPTERFVSIAVGDTLASAAVQYDLATPARFGDVTTYFKADASSKLMRRTVANANATGQLYYWSGNRAAGEWHDRGAWQDVLKDIVINELATDVSWVSITGASNSVATGGSAVQLTLNANGALDVGTNRSTVVVLGNYPGEDARAVQVVLDVAPVTLAAESSLGVTNWMGNYIAGNGTLDSALFQVVWAGPNGSIDPPALDGSATGDDEILARYPSGESYGRFGVGYEGTPDRGQFDEVFTHSLAPTSSSRTVYVRAWDAATIGTSVAYGDSAVYVVTNEAYESHDFGTWGVTTVPGYPGGGKDSNGDSVPDGWYVGNGLDPRAAIQGLTSGATHLSKFGSSGSGNGQFQYPSRIFLAEAFVYVLDRGNNRIQVWNRASETFAFAYTASPAFSLPRGMAQDPRSGVYRFAIADTGNHKVRVFTFNPTTGAIAESFSIGGASGSGDGQFISPNGVAIDLFGYIYVADTGNHRIQVFSDTGTFSRKFGSFGSTAGLLNTPRGLCVSSAGTVYVADTANNRVQLLNGFNGAPIFAFGTSGTGNGQFDQPTDVQLGIFERIFVIDGNNHRGQVFLQDGATFNHLFTFGSGGSGDGELLFPFGVAPVPTNGVIYVADTYNHRVVAFDSIVDADGDGMDDEWESSNGITDALGDADGDGILNIGEYRLGTGVNVYDTDGDEWRDGYEIWNGYDPFDPQYVLLRITSLADLPPLELRYMAESGGTYEIQTTTNLPGGNWTTIPSSASTPGSSGIISFTNAVVPAGESRFYRAVRTDN